jgi:prepilin-type N-terminal cleavage/methylation domain-containing protein
VRQVRGFSLLETMFTVAIMGGLMAILAGVFATATANLKLGATRLELQSELRRVVTPLRRDLRNTNFLSVSRVGQTCSVAANPPATQPKVDVARDGLALNGLKRPLLDSSYDSDSGKPLWDCYILYFATRDDPDGRLVRALLDDSPRSEVAKMLPGFGAGDLSASNPNLLDNSLKVLSQQVYAFGVELDTTNQLVQMHVKLRGRAGRREGKSTAEHLEVRFSLRPANTWPRL